MRQQRRITWESIPGDQGGFSMVAAMLALSLLALFGMIAASIAVNERRTSFNELVRGNSLLAADSGGEVAVAWFMTLDNWPKYDTADWLVRDVPMERFDSQSDQSFAFEAKYMESPITPGRPFTRLRDGYTGEFMDHIFQVDSDGEAGVEGHGSVTMVVHRIFRTDH